MWLSRQLRPTAPTADADLGTTTIAGGSAGVLTRGEVRSLPVYGPGGYCWQPRQGETVLVIKGGPGGEEQCVAGTRQKTPEAGLLPGEICIRGPAGTALWLRADGTIELTGQLRINGEAYKPCTCGEGGVIL